MINYNAVAINAAAFFVFLIKNNKIHEILAKH